MNITKLQAKVKADFDYTHTNDEGEELSEPIALTLNRMSFSHAAAKEFRVAMENADTDPSGIPTALAPFIADWNIYVDEDGGETEMMLPTPENIGALPPDFVAQLAEAVFGRLFPNPQKAKDLPRSSEPETSSAAIEATAN